MMTIGLIGLAVTLVLWARTRRPAWIFVLAIFAVVAASDVLHFVIGTTLLLIGSIIALAAILLFARGSARTALIVPLGVAVIATGAVFQGMMNSPAAQAGNTTAPNADTVKALTVTTASYTCQKDGNGLVAYDIGALKPVGDNGRKWSDAVSTPFKETAPAKMSDELAQAICHDPLVGSMAANYFANLKLGDFEVSSVNPWLNEFKGNPDKVVNVKAASYIGLLNVQNPSADQVAKAAARNNDYQQLAAKTVTLLTKYAGGGIQADMSETNYHLLGGGLAADSLPPVGLNDKQESLPALQLVLTQKGQEVCLDKIGFNTGDKRLETFKCAPPPKCAAGTDKAGQMIPEGQTAEWCTIPKPAPQQTTPSTSTVPSTPTPAPACTTCECSGNCPQACTTCECLGNCPQPCTTCACLGNCPHVCTTDCAKDWSKSVQAPPGVVPQPNDAYEPRPNPPATPAPVQPATQAPTSGSQAPGATTPDPARTQPAAGTGTTSSGSTGSVNPGTGGTGTNTADPGNPFG